MKLLFSFLLLTTTLVLPGHHKKGSLAEMDSIHEYIASDPSAESKINSYMTLSSMAMEHDFNQSLEYNKKAGEVAWNSGLRYYLTRIHVARGNILSEAGNFSSALIEYTRALKYNNLYGDVGDNSPGWPYLVIGNFFYRLEHYSKAEEFYDLAMTQFQSRNYPYGIAVVLNNKGLCQLRLNNDSTALAYFQKALDIRKSLDQPYLVAHSLLQISQALLKFNAYDRIDSLLRETNRILEDSERWEFKKDVMMLGAKVNIGLGNYEKARKNLEESFYYSGYPRESYKNTDIFLTYSRLEKAAGNYEQALEYAFKGYQLASSTKQFLHTEELLTEIMGLYTLMGKKDMALDYSHKIIHIQDSLDQSRNTALSDLLAFQKENQNLIQENLKKDKELDERDYYLFWAGIVIACFILLTLLILNIYSKLRKKEKLIKIAHQTTESLIQSVDSIVLFLNKRGKVRLINASGKDFYRNVLGQEISEGDDFYAMLSPEALEKWKKCIQKAKEMGSWSDIFQFKVKGEEKYYHKSFSRTTDENELYNGIIMVGTDLTEDKKMSLELERQRNELEKANVAKQKMLSLLAHDLKDSIFSAGALSDIVLASPKEHSKEDLLDYFKNLNINFNKTKDLLNGLLGWVKTQTGGMYAKPETFNLRELADAVIQTQEDKLVQKNVRLIVSENTDISLTGDPEMIRTVLRNLLSNAIKYSFQDSGEIRIFTIANKDVIEVHVQDNGVGIPRETQERLFEMPGLVSTLGTEKEQGTGFGLSLCHELLLLNESELKLRSGKDQGSDFYFCLRRSKTK